MKIMTLRIRRKGEGVVRGRIIFLLPFARNVTTSQIKEVHLFYTIMQKRKEDEFYFSFELN